MIGASVGPSVLAHWATTIVLNWYKGLVMVLMVMDSVFVGSELSDGTVINYLAHPTHANTPLQPDEPLPLVEHKVDTFLAFISIFLTSSPQ